MVKEKIIKEENNFLFYFMIILLILAVIILIINLNKVFNITGRATGTANLTVESVAQLNFTTNNINWGSGKVTEGQTNATLNTAGGASNVTNGNWTGNTAGLVLQNTGNNNVSLNISAGTDSAGLLGGTSPLYQYNFTNIESGSCLNSTGGTDALNLGTFVSANTTNVNVCGKFRYADGSDSLRIDLKLVIPSDSRTGAIGDIITATATTVS